ncbi:MAG TPA: lipoyl(octanoyl) transferase LipB [Candidatus Aquilonibacter sp.]|nr:lipoyl(octanoyl) transferase LipB [Candidatus Aquilonibacter sp.]
MRNHHADKTCRLLDLGLIPYLAAWELQQQLVEARKAGAAPDVLLLCEHPHVITLGRNGKREHLRAGDRLLAQRNVEFHPTDRGGDITYHGPGQIVGYPILDLAAYRRDVRWYVAQLEEVMIRASGDFGVAARRVRGRHGAWVDTPSGEEKLGALGVHLSRWVTSHGFAYNVSTDLRYFDLIVPCGIAGARATSLERILGRAVDGRAAHASLASHFGGMFGCNPEPISREDLFRTLPQGTMKPVPAAETSEGLEESLSRRSA